MNTDGALKLMLDPLNPHCYIGVCPFHKEMTPSFSYNAVSKEYYCFGCGVKGNIDDLGKELAKFVRS